MKDHIQSATGNILRQGLMHHKIFSEDRSCKLII